MTEGDEVEYRTLERFPDYRFGGDASIWSRKRGPWRKLKPTYVPSKGYLCLLLRDAERRRVNVTVHAVICEAFHGPKPPGMECCHFDCNSLNNAPSNLRWDTQEGNLADAIRLGRIPSGESHYLSKITEPDVVEMRRLAASGWTQERIAQRFGMSRSQTGTIIRGDCWKHIPGGIRKWIQTTCRRP